MTKASRQAAPPHQLMVRVVIDKDNSFTVPDLVTGYSVNRVPKGCPAVLQGLDTPGIRIELLPSGRVIRLPEEGEAIFFMNGENGRTVDSYRWPRENE